MRQGVCEYKTGTLPPIAAGASEPKGGTLRNGCMHRESCIMKKVTFALATVGAMLAGGIAKADTLSAEQIKSEVIGKRIYIATPFGGEFPLYYANSGNVSGDGTKLGLGKYFAPKETGRWWIQGSQLCQQWPTWYKGRQFCFTLQRTGENGILWNRDDGRSGEARIGS